MSANDAAIDQPPRRGATRIMFRTFGILAIPLFALVPSFASAQDTDADRVAFGADVHVREGEIVRDAVSFGGDCIVDGTVQGDAVAFGGRVELGEHARVEGDISSFGGEVTDHRRVAGPQPAAAPRHPPRELTMFDHFLAWVGDAAQS